MSSLLTFRNTARCLSGSATQTRTLALPAPFLEKCLLRDRVLLGAGSHLDQYQCTGDI